MMRQDYHRFGGNEELLREQEMRNAPEARRRVALALGPAPLEDARHLLPSVPLPPPFPPLPDGPLPATEFVVDLVGRFPLNLAQLRSVFPPLERAGLGFMQLFVQQERSAGTQGRWQRPDPLSNDARLTAIALSWELASLLSEGTEAIEELASYLLRAQERAERLLLTVSPRETPFAAAQRAGALSEIKARFSHTVEMRLMPQGRPFPARAVWRAAYALGMQWGNLDLFHWSDPATGTRLFSLNAVGHPGYFLPERAAEGEATPGIALSFELPRCPAPVETHDRMGIALAYLRQQLGGRPLTVSGAELDADHLYEERDALFDAVQEMSRLHIAPGSPTAARFF